MLTLVWYIFPQFDGLGFSATSQRYSIKSIAEAKAYLSDPVLGSVPYPYLPQMEVRSLYRHFDEEGFAFDENLYQAWQPGQTGFPIIDAAARCLLATGGWQAFNFRTRACYASFLSNLLGMDWRYGALHFMRHLIDSDCPIAHYQGAMQAGITSAIDKSWTRIYNPSQAAVDRFDPQGQFIKRWVPELRHLRPEQLGSPPVVKGYPAPVLNYKQARSQRVEQ